MNFFQKSKLNWYLKRKWRKRNILHGSPSQYGQYQEVFNLLGRPKYGTFVDIGANDSVTYSNSLLFEQKKWDGVCVEPHPFAFQLLSSSRKCHCVYACILNEESNVDFLLVEGPGNMLSGISDFMDNRHLQRIEKEIQQNGGKKRIVSVKATTPKDLLDRFSLTQIDYLSIDTEGCELIILKLFDFSQIHVRLIGVENGSRSPELFCYLTSIGYHLHQCVGCDEIYVKK